MGGDPVGEVDPLGLATKVNSESYQTKLVDPDDCKGIPRYDGPGKKWIDNEGNLHDPRNNKITRLPKGIHDEIVRQVDNWRKKHKKTPVQPQARDRAVEKGWVPDKGWKIKKCSGLPEGVKPTNNDLIVVAVVWGLTQIGEGLGALGESLFGALGGATAQVVTAGGGSGWW